MKAEKLGLLIAVLFLLTPAPSKAAVFQWIDSRGVIHFTDNYETVPESLRGSPDLITREDLATRGGSPETSAPIDTPAREYLPEPKAPEVASPEPIPAAATPQIIYYSPQYQIVVVNSIVRRPFHKVCASPGGCKPVFRPNFDDRRFIHPSVFDGGSRQFIQPELFPSGRK